jgi:hypothetical protein
MRYRRRSTLPLAAVRDDLLGSLLFLRADAARLRSRQLARSISTNCGGLSEWPTLRKLGSSRGLGSVCLLRDALLKA